MRCFNVLTILRKQNVATLGNVTEAGWAELIEQSKPTEEDAFDPTELWRNEDVTEPSRKFLVRVDSVQLALKQPAMPKQLEGKLLAAKARDGRSYCALFQSNTCKEAAVSLVRADGRQMDCKFGLHSCAVIF